VERPGIRVLYVSGYTDDETVRRGVSQNEVSLLSKPFTPKALVVKVREVLDRQLAGALRTCAEEQSSKMLSTVQR
jgi:DNA-binding response OmpR family regulator